MVYIGFFDPKKDTEVYVPGDGPIAWASREELGEATARLIAEVCVYIIYMILALTVRSTLFAGLPPERDPPPVRPSLQQHHPLWSQHASLDAPRPNNHSSRRDRR